MNPRVLTACLAASAVTLTGVAAWLALSRPSNPAAAPDGAPVHTTTTPSTKTIVRPGGEAGGAVVEPAWRWSSLESEDYRRYIAALRAIECPERTIHDIILADLNKLYAPREAPYKDPTDAVANPWDVTITPASNNAAANRKADYERRKKLREIEKEKAAVVKELLGIDLPLTPLQSWQNRNYDRVEAALNALPPEKRERAREVMEMYWETSDTLADATSNKRTAAYAEQYRQINERRKTSLLQVLSPDELEEFDMRSSNISQRLSTDFTGLNVSEEEFKTLYRARAAIEEPYGPGLNPNQIEGFDPKQASDKQKELADLLKQTLGDDRYAQFQKAQDGDWQVLNRLKQRFELSDESVQKAYDAQKALASQTASPTETATRVQELQQQLRAASRNRAGTTAPPPEERAELVRQLQAENAKLQEEMQRQAEERRQKVAEIAAFLGDRAGKVFSARVGGNSTFTETINSDGRVLRVVPPTIPAAPTLPILPTVPAP